VLLSDTTFGLVQRVEQQPPSLLAPLYDPSTRRHISLELVVPHFKLISRSQSECFSLLMLFLTLRLKVLILPDYVCPLDLVFYYRTLFVALVLKRVILFRFQRLCHTFHFLVFRTHFLLS